MQRYTAAREYHAGLKGATERPIYIVSIPTQNSGVARRGPSRARPGFWSLTYHAYLIPFHEVLYNRSVELTFGCMHGACSKFWTAAGSPANHEGAMRAHPGNWKLKAKFFPHYGLSLYATFGSSAIHVPRQLHYPGFTTGKKWMFLGCKQRQRKLQGEKGKTESDSCMTQGFTSSKNKHQLASNSS